MTDAAVPHFGSSPAAAALRRRRYAAERRLRVYGIAAISTALGLLGLLIVSLFVTGLPAFTQTTVRVDFPIPVELVGRDAPEKGNFRKVVADGVAALTPGAESPAQAREMAKILTANTQFIVRDAVVADPRVIGGTLTLDIPVSDPYDQLAKGLVDRNSPPTAAASRTSRSAGSTSSPPPARSSAASTGD